MKFKNMAANATILIVNWNAGDYLIRCLQSIPTGYPIVVVDNNSRDGSIDKVSSIFPEVRVIRSAVNLGFSAGNNLGLKEINTKYVFFLNPDTEIVGDAVGLMIQFLENHPDYEAVGPKIIESQGRICQFAGRRHFNLWTGFCEAFLLDKIFPRSNRFNYRNLPEWDRQTSRDIECLSGCAMLMRTDTVKLLNGFDESVPLYLDDNDLCRKITERGGKIRCLVEANIWHMHNVSGRQAPAAWITHLNLKACYIYLKKYHTVGAADFYLILLFFAALMRVPLFFLVSLFFSEYQTNLKTSTDILMFSLFYWNSNILERCPD
jgi:N-acetylglucosaminyl-diphospho-decaprenol L-rhamnosyltransferase